MPSSPLEVTTLHNGLRVAVAPSDSPGVALNLWYDVGSVDESPTRTGFAHLFEHLMFQGSANVAPGEHMALIEAMGGTVNATTSSERTNYFETVPPGGLELALWLEADRLASLAITDENFEAQREVVKEEKRERYDNQPYGDLLQLIIEQHFPPEHPYGHLTIGSMQHLDEASIDEVSAFFDAWYRPSNAKLVLTGPVSPDDGFKLAQKYFGDLPRLDPPAERIKANVALHAPSTLSVTRDVPYPLVYLSWPTSPAAADDQPAIDLALTLLADGHASRLHQQLVKEEGVAQEAHAIALTHRRAPSIAMIVIRPADAVSSKRAADVALEAVQAFCEEGPTEAEFQRAVAQHERSWLWQLSTAEGRADLFNEAWQIWGDPARVHGYLDSVLALTPDDVRQAAARWLRPDTTHQLHYLPKEA
ncbi:MAG: pitrilysin family protein [Propionibacteriaceae bacterium]|nr:pitrilysin family protein [Propionibacteriaceae bacterium]